MWGIKPHPRRARRHADLHFRARDRPEECAGLLAVPSALLLLSAAAEELPGLLVLRQLRPAHHAELAQSPLRLCPQSAPEEHATAREH